MLKRNVPERVFEHARSRGDEDYGGVWEKHDGDFRRS